MWYRLFSQSQRKTGSRRTGPAHRLSFRPRLEVLETRLAPATRIWDGGSAIGNNWTDAANWVGDVAPVANDDLVFPAGAARLGAANDFLPGTPFNSIRFTAGGYSLNGNQVVLGPGGMVHDTSAAPDFSTIDLPLMLPVNRIFNVVPDDVNSIL